MSLKAPRSAVKSVRDLICWEYACLIAEGAGFAGNYGFVMSRFKKLKSGEMSWSGTMRDFLKQMEKGPSCIYCGATETLTADHIVPSSRAGITLEFKRFLNRKTTACWHAEPATARRATGMRSSGIGTNRRGMFRSSYAPSPSSWSTRCMRRKARSMLQT